MAEPVAERARAARVVLAAQVGLTALLAVSVATCRAVAGQPASATAAQASSKDAVVEIAQLADAAQLLSSLEGSAYAPEARAIARGDTVGAIRRAEQAIAAREVDADAQLLLALAWYRAGADGSIADHLRALAIRQTGLASSLAERLAGVYLRERRLYRADQLLNAIPATARTNQTRFMRAHLAARQQRLADSLAELTVLGRRVPGSVPIARDESQIALLSAHDAQAAAAVGRWLRVRADDPEARAQLARARIQQGRFDDAQSVLASLSSQRPGDAATALQLGLVELARGRFAEAHAALARARAADSQASTPSAADAVTSLAAGDRAGAVAAASEALKRNPADQHAALALVFAASPGTEKARNSVAVAARYFPDLERLPLPDDVAAELADAQAAGRTAVLVMLNELWSPRAARSWLDRVAGAAQPLWTLKRAQTIATTGDRRGAQALVSALPDSLVGRSLFQAAAGVAAGERDLAADAIRRAVTIAPGVAGVHERAGDLYAALGLDMNAIAEYRVSARLAPPGPTLINGLAASLARIGTRTQLDEALQLAEDALAERPHYLTRARLLATRADLLLRLGRDADAYAAYRELAGTVGGMVSPELWSRLGELAFARRDAALACKAYEEALDMGRDFPQRAEAITRLATLEENRLTADTRTPSPDRP